MGSEGGRKVSSQDLGGCSERQPGKRKAKGLFRVVRSWRKKWEKGIIGITIKPGSDTCLKVAKKGGGRDSGSEKVKSHRKNQKNVSQIGRGRRKSVENRPGT